MAETGAGEWATLGCVEIVNAQRVLAYMANGVSHPSIQLSGTCGCPRISQLVCACECVALQTCPCISGCTEIDYVLPDVDPAPWFDSAIPESAEFAGFLPTEFTGLGSTYTREQFDTISGGAVLGRLRASARTFTWRGFLFGRTCCGVQYGLRWLTAQLAGTPICSSGCEGEDLNILVCCPNINTTPDCGPEIENPITCDAFRTFKKVGLLEGPTILSERKIGCATCGGRGCPTTPDCSTTCQESCIIEVEFSLLAGSPYQYKCPVTVCELEFPDPPSGCIEFIEVPPGSLDDCISSSCPVVVNCSDEDPGCPQPSLPDIPDFAESCGFCDALDPVTVCCSISNDAFGQFFESVPIITITTGPELLRNTEVKFLENLAEQDCDEFTAEDIECRKCDSIRIRYIPPSSTLIIDGTTRRITIQCPGDPEGVPGEHLTASPFAWPTLACINYCVCVTTDAAGKTDFGGAMMQVDVVPRHM